VEGLLGGLPEGGLGARPANGGASVAEMLAHICNVRLRWVSRTAPDLVEQLVWFERRPELPREAEQLREGLAGSAGAVAGMLQRRGAAALLVEGFPGPLSSFVGYLISHEAYHIGEVGLALAQSGVPLSPEAERRIWVAWWGGQ
jgi:uncharacterized damage-inducible protein DinB